MATSETTPSVKNYLGHPCRLASALDRFADPLQDSRKKHTDPRALAQSIGHALQTIMDRCDHANDVAELVRDRTEPSEDMQLHALLAMGADYTRATCDALFDLTGMVLDALERGDFVMPSQAQEVAHG